MTRKILILGTMFLACGGCNYKQSKQAIATPATTTAVSPDFAMIQAIVFEPKCVSCHGSGGNARGGLSLDSLAAVRRAIDRVSARALVDRTMPPGTPLSDGEANLLRSWIAAGTPEITDSHTPSTSAQPANWQNVETDFFAKHCTTCHSIPAPDGNLDLTSLGVVREKASAIFDRVNIRRDMPISPFGAPTEDERRWLANWIVAGMPD